ncbi:MAG: DUF5801 repeats-in-toxin domain-containing protein, partial [Legionella sp.]
MTVNTMSGVVHTLQGILTRIDAEGHSSLIKQGAVFKPGDSLTLLSGAANISLNDGQAITLMIDKPYTFDGISPLLKPRTFLWDEFIEPIGDKSLELAKLLASFESTTSGEYLLSSGGSIFVLDPMFGSGLVTSGFDTRGPFAAGLTQLEHGVQWYANTEPEAILTLTSNVLNLDESLVVRNNDFNAADSAGISDPFNYGTLIGFSQGFLVSAANSVMNQPANMVSASYKLELGDGLSTLRASDGSVIILSIENNIIVGKSGSEVIFAIGIDAASGKITVAQYQGLYHPDPNAADEAINLTGLVKVILTLTDRSGDVSTASVDIGSKINFEDDAPFIHSITGVQLIDDQANGVPIIGEINVDFGSDLAKDVVFADAINSLIKANLTSNGNALTYSIDASSHQLTATNAVNGATVFTLTLSDVIPNAPQQQMPQYSLIVYEAIDQPQDIDKISVDIPIKAIDADNDSVLGYINIIIDDGGDPVGGFDTGFIADEGDLTGGGAGYPTALTTTHSFSIPAGADRLIPASLSVVNSSLEQLINEFQHEITAGGSPLVLSVVSQNGVITITATDNQNSSVFTLTITPTNTGNDLTVDVTLVQFKPLDHQLNGNGSGLVQQDGDSIRINLPLQAKDSDGDPLQSPVNLHVTINDGLAPQLGSDQLSFQEGRSVQSQTGTLPLDLGSDAIATMVFQDNATMQHSLGDLTSGNKATSYVFEQNGRVLVLKIDDASSPLNGQELLRVTINTDGSYTAVLSGPLDQINNNASQLVLPVLATDKDGDISNLGAITLIISDANNAAPLDNPAATVSIVEGDLSPASYPVSSNVSFTLPSSGDRLLPESIRFDATVSQLINELSNEIKVDGQALTFTQNGTVITGSLNGEAVVVIELTAGQSANHYDVSAQVKITLNGPIDHNQSDASGLVQLQGDQIIIAIGVQIQDADGDYLSMPAQVNASIIDGLNPVLTTNERITLTEPVTAESVSAQANFVINLGSDPIKTLGFDYASGELSGLKSAGHDVLFEVVAGVLKGYYLEAGIRVDVLAATINYSDLAGTVVLELFKPVDHSQAGQDSLSLDLKIRAVDTDGDATSLLLPVDITDSILAPSDLTATVIEGQTVTGSLADGYNLHAEGGQLH